ncbi:MAG: hypothetical protein KAR11_06575 [Phycisphaerae bacterium]|nr:hypothetical protein [Phycisphaerae bacterium]
MDFDTTLGLILVVTAVVLLCGLVWWSRRIINYIDRTGARSARMIQRDLATQRGKRNGK